MVPGKQVGMVVTAWTIAPIVGIGLMAGCDNRTLTTATRAPVAKVTQEDESALEPRIVSFCGDCHGYPTADLFPKGSWDAEVRRGFKFSRNSDRKLDAPPIREVIAHYEAAAPDRLPIIPRTPDGPGPMRPLVRGEIAGPRRTRRPRSRTLPSYISRTRSSPISWCATWPPGRS